MVEVTENAMKELEAYFVDKEVTPIRIYLAPGGWSGPRLSLALDELHDTDDKFEVGNFTFVVEKDLMKQASPISIDISYMGFTVNSSLELGGGSCGTCSSGSCG